MEQRVGNYTVLRELARGGMGVVYVARQDGLAREVALKLHLGAAAGSEGDSAKEARARERFDREAKAVARLRHPHVIQVHEFGHHRGVPYLAMDLIDGESLEQRLEREGALEPSEALRLLAPVTEAVAYAHSQGILHRDIKPANILISREGHPFLTDFGLAKDLSDERDRLTRSGQLLGTPYYMAPEAAAGATKEIDARSDVYALGAVLFQALTGEPAFVGDSLIELLRSIVSDPPTPPSHVQPNVPPELDAVVLQCLEKEPQHRYADAGELAADLARFTQGEPVSASRSSLSRGLRRISASRAWLLLPFLVAVGVLGFVVDRAWLAPARAADASLQAELAWQRERLRPTLYGLDPRRPLEVSPGDLRKRLDQVEALPDSVDPALRSEARAYLAAYTWLLEQTRGRRHSARGLAIAPGRPDVAVRAIALAEGGDFAGAQRILAEALPDAPELRATELALLARYEPGRFFASGPNEGALSELKAATLPLALRAHYEQLLGDGLSGGRVEFRQRLSEAQAQLQRWGEVGSRAAREALAQRLEESASRYARLEELDPDLALERLDRLRFLWLSVPGGRSPKSLEDALRASWSACLAQALTPDAGGREAARALEVDLCFQLLSGERPEGSRPQLLTVLYATKADGREGNSWSVDARSLVAVARMGQGDPDRALSWLQSMIRIRPRLCDQILELYPEQDLGRFLPIFDPRRTFREDEFAGLCLPAPSLPADVLRCLRHLAARELYGAGLRSRLTQALAIKGCAELLRVLEADPPQRYDHWWRTFDVAWCLASLRGDPEPAREAFADHVAKLRQARARGAVGDLVLSRAILELARVSGRERGEPLLLEAIRIRPDWIDQAAEVRSGWR